jgi:hypothetical protein
MGTYLYTWAERQAVKHFMQILELALGYLENADQKAQARSL